MRHSSLRSIATAWGILAVATFGAGLGSDRAEANHGSFPWYAARWRLPAENQVRYFFDDDFPTSYRGLARNGAATWDNAPGGTVALTEAGVVDDNRWNLDHPEDRDCNLDGEVVVQYGPLVEGGWDIDLALSPLCFLREEQRMLSATIRMSNDRHPNAPGPNPTGDFYFGTNEDVPTELIDFWGVITHEWGHVMGRAGGPEGSAGHFPRPSVVSGQDACDKSNGSTYSTMCDRLGPNLARWRTLSTHDLSSYDLFYP